MSKQEKVYTVLVPEIVLTEYKVSGESPYVALGKANYESTYRMRSMKEEGNISPTERPWFVVLNGQMIPFSMTTGEDGSYWHVWGMGEEDA